MHQRIPVHFQSQSGQITKQRRRPFNQGDSWLKSIEIPSHAKKCIEMPSFGSICNWACFEVLGQSKWRISLVHLGSHCYMASDASELWPNFSRVSPKYFSTWWQGGETWQAYRGEKHDFPSSGVSCWMWFLYLLIPLMVSLMLRLITTCVSLLSGTPEMPYNQET